MPASTALAAGLKIGLSLPLTSNSSLLADQFLQGARLAVSVLAPEGSIELVTADDGCKSDTAELATADLRNAGVSLATGFLCNEAAFAGARGFKHSGIPVLVAGARSERLMKDRAKEGWNVWRLAPADRDAAVAAAAALSVRWRGRPWAIIDDGTAFGRTFADDLRSLMEQAGVPPQFADNFRPAQSTQASLVHRLQRSGVSAAFVSAAAAEDVALIAKNMHELGGNIELAGGPTLALLPLIDQAADVPDGLIGVLEPDPATLESARGLSQILAQREIEPEPYVYLGYAALEIALAAVRSDPAETTAALADTVFRTVLGNVDFDKAGRNRLNPYGIYVWRGGSFHPTGGGEP